MNRRDPIMPSMVAGLNYSERSAFFEPYFDDLVIFQKKLPHLGVLRRIDGNVLVSDPAQILYSITIGGIQIPAREYSNERFILGTGSVRVGKEGVLEGIESLGERYKCYIPFIEKMEKPF